MTDANLKSALYILAFALFIYGLSGLTGPRTAVRGNRIAAVGMVIAVAATLLVDPINNIVLIVLGLLIGVAVGVPAARQVRMTAMPQMVALFNGVGGGAVALIAWAEFRETGGFATEPTYVAIFSIFSALVGSISFWGSNIAFAKLQALMSGSPKSLGALQLPVQVVIGAVALGAGVFMIAEPQDEIFMIALLVAAGIVGVMLVLPIGGADMPVVISLLNAFTGLAAAAAGVALDNQALIVAGMIVGASGTILTQQMAIAMNRTITSVVVGGFGGDSVAAGPGADGAEGGTVRSTSAADAAIQMSYARQVVVVPGYGMAVAQAQHAVREMAKVLEAKGVEVKYAIHPVAGRMPGHMNVLLAEADVPYEQLKEMDEINQEFGRTDVSLVIGANDVTNPDARNKADSPIYGMPILNVDESGSVIVLKRSMSSGYAGIENPLFYNDKTQMLFGDAKASVGEITAELGAL
ncbi:MAG: NAD(P)(+) transhydrogenase (Re/Si-specific) subunit beta [Solirubrobacterales bacterium]|nr:NAD(P)(+) transhydrogenase (Re/Si-specific) subunit beta [Solirubrobacterales bacterium]